MRTKKKGIRMLLMVFVMGVLCIGVSKKEAKASGSTSPVDDGIPYIEFVNTKAQGVPFAPYVQKQITDSQGTPTYEWDYTEKPFTFTISSENAPLPEPAEAQTNGAGIAVWPEVILEYGKTYDFTITENNTGYEGINYDLKPHTLSVTVDGEGNLTMTWDGEPTGITALENFPESVEIYNDHADNSLISLNLDLNHGLVHATMPDTTKNETGRGVMYTVISISGMCNGDDVKVGLYSNVLLSKSENLLNYNIIKLKHPAIAGIQDHEFGCLYEDSSQDKTAGLVLDIPLYDCILRNVDGTYLLGLITWTNFGQEGETTYNLSKLGTISGSFPTITNTKATVSATLPNTGGSGNAVFISLLGLCVFTIGIAGVCFVNKRKC